MSSLVERRNFLRFLATSPLAARTYAQESAKITSPKDVLAVMDLEEVARQALPPAHWGYMSSGVDDNNTLAANIGAFKHIGLRPKRLSGVVNPDTPTELLGAKFESPIY